MKEFTRPSEGHKTRSQRGGYYTPTNTEEPKVLRGWGRARPGPGHVVEVGPLTGTRQRVVLEETSHIPDEHPSPGTLTETLVLARVAK